MSPPDSANSANSERSAESAGEARYVVYEYCISIVAVTLRRPTRPIRLRPGQRAWLYGLPYVVVSLLFGWWGLPWGVVYTPMTIFSNLYGGCDITSQVRAGGCPRV